jgi:hypothetical protein
MVTGLAEGSSQPQIVEAGQRAPFGLAVLDDLLELADIGPLDRP